MDEMYVAILLYYLLGYTWHLQHDGVRSVGRLKRIYHAVAYFEYTCVTAYDKLRSLMGKLYRSLRLSSSPTEQAFVYPSIRQTSHWRSIRLLRLNPGRLEQPLTGSMVSCSIVTVSVWSWQFDMPRYEALSYCWGSSTLSKSILLDGQPLQITPKLYAALQHLRPPDQSRYLWVDQICIHQKSVAERNYQVRRMGEIYANAQRVVIWLGEETAASKVIFGALDQVDESMAMDRSMYLLRNLHTDHPIRKSIISEMGKAMQNSEFLRMYQNKLDAPTDNVLQRQLLELCFQVLLTNAWFEKTWTLQEAALAKEIVIQAGKQTLPWRRFVGACRVVFTMHEKPRLPVQSYQAVELVEVLRHSWYTHNGLEIDLLRMLEYCRPRQATDPRDKVYGLLAMYTPWSVVHAPAERKSDNGEDSGECVAFSEIYAQRGGYGYHLPTIDYNKSKEHVFVDVALSCMSSGKLDILKDRCALEETPMPGSRIGSALHGKYISKSAPSKRELPSWVTDWSIDAVGECQSPLLEHLRMKKQPYSASKNLYTDRQVIFEAGTELPSSSLLRNATLVLTGLLFDSVAEVVENIHTQDTSPKSSSQFIWQEWTHLALRHATCGPYETSDGCIEAFWRTLIADKSGVISMDRASADVGTGFQDALCNAIVPGDLPSGWEAQIAGEGKVYYINRNTESTSWAHPRAPETLQACGGEAKEALPDKEYMRRSQALRTWLESTGNRHLKRKLFRTQRGYLGMSCLHVQKGDRVCVLWSGRLPFILRARAIIRLTSDGKTMESSNAQDTLGDHRCFRTHELIGGECYIHGLAEGQAISIANEEDLEPEKIYLQ